MRVITRNNRALKAHKRENLRSNLRESGNATLEFIGLLLLLGLPMITYFSQISRDSIEELMNQEVFREVTQIIKYGEDFSESISVARRFLTLHNSQFELVVTCEIGDCPKRGSKIKVILRSQKTVIEGSFGGSQWG